jgi:Ca-activated chloride channel family protein
LEIARWGAGWRRRVAGACVWLAVAGVVLAASQPSLGDRTAGRKEILELVVDVSGSTQATDVIPTRLSAIQGSLLRLLDQLPPRVRVGAVSFSGSATNLTRPTSDRDAARGKILSLSADGPTAIGDALKLALAEVQAARPALPATVLLVSDGTNTQGSNPAEAARKAQALHVRILAVAVGRPDGTVEIPDEQSGQLVRVPVPPDPAQLSSIAGPTGGRAAQARSAAELDAAVHDLASQAGLIGDPRELTLLFAAAALLLLAIAGALSPRRRPAPDTRLGRLAAVWPPAPSAALLLAAARAVTAWSLWVPPSPPSKPTKPGAAAAAAVIVTPSPKQPVLQPPPFISINATRRDRVLLEQAAALLRRHGELAAQRQAEITRRHLNQVAALSLSACDVCKGGPLTVNGGYETLNGRFLECATLLNTGFIRQQARRWQLPVPDLVAMAVLHEQELCLQTDHSTTSPVDAEQRFARKLHNSRLFDRFYAQIHAGPRDRQTVEQALAVVRDHGELAFQRRDDLRRRKLNQVDPLRITVCRSCRSDRTGEAVTTEERGDTVACEILIDMAGVEENTRSWSLSVTEVTAVLLAHEQEHCVRAPDDRETPAVDEEARLARKLGRARLIEYVTASYSNLDKTGHWKR